MLINLKSPSFLPYALLVVSASALVLAWIAEYGFGLHPCPLCMYQRIPYAIISVVSIIALIGRNIPVLRTLCMYLAIGLLWIEMGLAGYHMGVEYGWWSGLTGCSGSSGAQTVEALMAEILSSAAVQCDEPAFIFVLSMAGWNMLYACAAAGASMLYLFKKY